MAREFANKNLKYWCVESHFADSVSEIYLHAERFELTAQGCVVFYDGVLIIHAMAAHEWSHIYAASCLTGDYLYIDHWNKEKKEE